MMNFVFKMMNFVFKMMNSAGDGCAAFGRDVCRAFLKASNLGMLIRSHECPREHAQRDSHHNVIPMDVSDRLRVITGERGFVEHHGGRTFTVTTQAIPRNPTQSHASNHAIPRKQSRNPTQAITQSHATNPHHSLISRGISESDCLRFRFRLSIMLNFALYMMNSVLN